MGRARLGVASHERLGQSAARFLGRAASAVPAQQKPGRRDEILPRPAQALLSVFDAAGVDVAGFPPVQKGPDVGAESIGERQLDGGGGFVGGCRRARSPRCQVPDSAGGSLGVVSLAPASFVQRWDGRWRRNAGAPLVSPFRPTGSRRSNRLVLCAVRGWRAGRTMVLRRNSGQRSASESCVVSTPTRGRRVTIPCRCGAVPERGVAGRLVGGRRRRHSGSLVLRQWPCLSGNRCRDANRCRRAACAVPAFVPVLRRRRHGGGAGRERRRERDGGLDLLRLQDVLCRLPGHFTNAGSGGSRCRRHRGAGTQPADDRRR